MTEVRFSPTILDNKQLAIFSQGCIRLLRDCRTWIRGLLIKWLQMTKCTTPTMILWNWIHSQNIAEIKLLRCICFKMRQCNSCLIYRRSCFKLLLAKRTSTKCENWKHQMLYQTLYFVSACYESFLIVNFIFIFASMASFSIELHRPYLIQRAR